MKGQRIKLIFTAVLIAVLLGGCTLMSSYFMEEYHFWTLNTNGLNLVTSQRIEFSQLSTG
jgi:hypothetical protein